MKKIMSVVLALILVSALSVSVFAAGSVVAPIINDYEGGTATITQDTTGNGREFTFTVDTKDGYNFVGWEIDGNYEIVSGSLDSETVTVRFLDDVAIEDISAEPIFEEIGTDEPDEPTEPEEKTTTTKKKDVSPKTGDSMAMVALATVALAGVVVSKKKLSK